MESTQTIDYNFTDKEALYRAYMPFVKNGGLFIHSQQHYNLGTNLIMSVKLPNEAENHRIEAKVVWITPVESQGNKFPDVGVQFTGENNRLFRRKIETYLADMLESTETTDTF